MVKLPDATNVEGNNVVAFARKSANSTFAVETLDADRTERPSVANTYLPGPQLGSSSGKYTVTPWALEAVRLVYDDRIAGFNIFPVLSMIGCSENPEGVRDGDCERVTLCVCVCEAVIVVDAEVVGLGVND